MVLIIIVQYVLSITLLLSAIPSDSQSEVTIYNFDFVDTKPLFVIGQPLTVKLQLELEVSTNEPIKHTYNIQLYFNGGEEFGMSFSKEIHFPSPIMNRSRQYVFRDTNEDAVDVTLPELHCDEIDQYCVKLESNDTTKLLTKCLNRTRFFVTICQKPEIGLNIPNGIDVGFEERNSVIYVLSLTFTLQVVYNGDYYVSFRGSNSSGPFSVKIFNETSGRRTDLDITDLKGEEYSYYVPSKDSVMFFVSESLLINNCTLHGDMLCVEVTPKTSTATMLTKEVKECTSIQHVESFCPLELPAYFWPAIVAAIVIVIFGVAVTIVLVRYRKRIARSRFWVDTKSPHEAYSIIRKRLNMKNWYETRQRGRAHKRPPINVVIEPDITRNEHSERPNEFDDDLTTGGNDNSQYLQDNSHETNTYPEGHSYEPNLQSLSGASSSSHRIHATIESNTNLAKNFSSNRQESSVSIEQANSDRSYLHDRGQSGAEKGRSASIFPVKPEVNFENGRISPMDSYSSKQQWSGSSDQNTSAGSYLQAKRKPIERPGITSIFPVKNEVNLENSQSRRQESLLSTEQDNSAGSYEEASNPLHERCRAASIFPVKPDVTFQRTSPGPDVEPSTPEAIRGSKRFIRLPPIPLHQSDTSGENEDAPKVVETSLTIGSGRTSETHSSRQESSLSTDQDTSAESDVRTWKYSFDRPRFPPIVTSKSDIDPATKPSTDSEPPTPDDTFVSLGVPPLPPSPHPRSSSSGGNDHSTLVEEPLGPPVPVKPKPPKKKPVKVPPKPKPKLKPMEPASQTQTTSNEHSGREQPSQKKLRDVLQQTLDTHYPSSAISAPNRSDAGTIKRTPSAFAAAVQENFFAIVEELENPQEIDVGEVPANSGSSDADVSEAISEERDETPLRIDTETRVSKIKDIVEESNTSYVYVNKWNKSWEFKRSHLWVDRDSHLGEGQFGKVYQGIADNIAGRPGDTTVAVKELKNGATNEEKDEFLKELAIHTLMESHQNVIGLLGCCIRDEPICIILEFMENGSLLSYLRKQQRTESLAQNFMVNFGHQIALGMEHVSNMGIVHRDLAARNILISDQLVCKVSDFGYARDVFGVKTYNKAPEKAPIRWYSPETVLYDTFTTKTDVWALGILLFEIITMGHVLPYHEEPSTATVQFKIAAGGVPPKPVMCNDELYNVMKMCWHRQPDDRPEFAELATVLSQLKTKY